MEQAQPRGTLAVPVSALALAVGAAASFGVGDAVGFLSDTAEGIFILTWLLGWMLLIPAAIFGGGYAVVLARRWLSGQPVSRVEAALIVASLVLTAVVLATHPLWGTGSGSA